MRILYVVFIQPLLNIFNAWHNILNGNFCSLDKIEYDYDESSYQSDYNNIARDFRQIGSDMKRVIIDYDNEK